MTTILEVLRYGIGGFLLLAGLIGLVLFGRVLPVAWQFCGVTYSVAKNRRIARLVTTTALVFLIAWACGLGALGLLLVRLL